MSEAQLTPFASALADFSLNLYRQISGGNADGNIFLSPLSISLALGMTLAGADGNTKAQMKKLLFGDWIDKEDGDLHSMFTEVMGILNKEGAPYKLQLANRVYVNELKLGQLRQQFSNILKEKYASELQALDFSKDDSRNVINSWVSEKTNKKIQDLIPLGVLSDLTRLVLVNAIYFKGDWQTKFDSAKTVEKPFYVSPQKKLRVEMMHLHNQEFHYNEGPSFQVLGMPYSGTDLFMFIWLPKERFGLAELEKSLTGKTLLDSILQADEEVKIKTVAFPKFKLEESLTLADHMKALGAGDMFDGEKADFSNINGKRDLYVSAVIHKAFIEVNEEGTEAAAATAVVVAMYCSADATPKRQLVFIADHPFVFAIVDKRTTSIVFLGRFNGK